MQTNVELLQVQYASGNLPNLLRVAVEESLDTTLRQVAAIQVKNVVKRGWDPQGTLAYTHGGSSLFLEAQIPRLMHQPFFETVSASGVEGESLIPAADRQALRDNLLESLIRAPRIVQSQLGECMKSIVLVDFPHNWPSLLPQLSQNLGSQVGYSGLSFQSCQLHGPSCSIISSLHTDTDVGVPILKQFGALMSKATLNSWLAGV